MFQVEEKIICVEKFYVRHSSHLPKMEEESYFYFVEVDRVIYRTVTEGDFGLFLNLYFDQYLERRLTPLIIDALHRCAL